MLPKLIPWYEQKMFIVYKESDESLSQRFWDPNMLFEVRWSITVKAVPRPGTKLLGLISPPVKSPLSSSVRSATLSVSPVLTHQTGCWRERARHGGSYFESQTEGCFLFAAGATLPLGWKLYLAQNLKPVLQHLHSGTFWKKTHLSTITASEQSMPTAAAGSTEPVWQSQ